MVFFSVESLAKTVGVDHRTGEAVFLQSGKVVGAEQVDRFHAHLLADGAQLIERDLPVTPFAYRLIDAIILDDSFGAFCCDGVCRMGQ